MSSSAPVVTAARRVRSRELVENGSEPWSPRGACSTQGPRRTPNAAISATSIATNVLPKAGSTFNPLEVPPPIRRAWAPNRTTALPRGGKFRGNLHTHPKFVLGLLVSSAVFPVSFVEVCPRCPQPRKARWGQRVVAWPLAIAGRRTATVRSSLRMEVCTTESAAAGVTHAARWRTRAWTACPHRESTVCLPGPNFRGGDRRQQPPEAASVCNRQLGAQLGAGAPAVELHVGGARRSALLHQFFFNPPVAHGALGSHHPPRHADNVERVQHHARLDLIEARGA